MRQVPQYEATTESGDTIILTVPPSSPDDAESLRASAQQMSDMQGAGRVLTIKHTRMIDWPHG